MRVTILKIIGLASILALGACATSTPALQGQLDAQFGQATRANIAAHAVMPTAAQKANTYIPADPFRTALARKHYKENTAPDPISTGP